MTGKNAAAEQRRRQVLAAASALTLSLGLAASADAAATAGGPAMVPGVGKTVKTRDAASGMSTGKRQHKPVHVAGHSTGQRQH